jgi:hypothetical protein
MCTAEQVLLCFPTRVIELRRAVYKKRTASCSFTSLAKGRASKIYVSNV